MKSRPGEIERGSMAIITEELTERGCVLPEEHAPVILRCIHASADFDYAENLRFTPGAAEHAASALRGGTVIVTDTNMALAGISRPAMKVLGCTAVCFMAEETIAAAAKKDGTTRAAAAMNHAGKTFPHAAFAVGNAPTALFSLADQIETGLRPALVIAAPVGFVNVMESKERIFQVCTEYSVPCIAAMGRKGGSSIAAAICNALLYSACDMTDPKKRGWD